MNFQDTIDTLRQRLHTDSPVVQAQARLATGRAALVTDLKNFQKRKPKSAQTLGEARAKQQQAASVGVRHATLEHLLEQCYGLLDGTESMYQDALAQIDRLTEMDLNFVGCEAHLADLPRILSSNLGRLEELAKEAQRLTKDGGELDELVRQAAGQPPATMTTGSQPGPSSQRAVRVDSNFEL